MQSRWDSGIICGRDTMPDFTDTVTLWKDQLLQLSADFRLGEQGQLAFSPAHPKLLRLTYQGHTRHVEPYALRFKRRDDGIGQAYLYVWDRTGGRTKPGIKSLLNYRIDNLAITDEPFQPHFEIELTKA